MENGDGGYDSRKAQKIENLIQRPGTPGEGQAAYEALKRMGPPPLPEKPANRGTANSSESSYNLQQQLEDEEAAINILRGKRPRP